jgi:hypothetical protein
VRRILFALSLSVVIGPALLANAGTGRVVKVLPHLLDLRGRNTIYPSLYDRDAYQALLRREPEKRSGIRFDVQWRTKGAIWEPLTLRVELRGTTEGSLPRELVLEKQVKPGGWFGEWTSFPVVGEQYKSIGEVTAWRVTLWEGQQMLGEQQSFLW